MASTTCAMHFDPGPFSSIDCQRLPRCHLSISFWVFLLVVFHLWVSTLMLFSPTWCSSFWLHVLPTVLSCTSLFLLSPIYLPGNESYVICGFSPRDSARSRTRWYFPDLTPSNDCEVILRRWDSQLTWDVTSQRMYYWKSLAFTLTINVKTYFPTIKPWTVPREIAGTRKFTHWKGN